MTTDALNTLILSGIDTAALYAFNALLVAAVAWMALLLVTEYPRWKRRQAAPPVLPVAAPPPAPLAPLPTAPPPSPRLHRMQERLQEWRDLHDRQQVADAVMLAVAQVALGALAHQGAGTPRNRRA